MRAKRQSNASYEDQTFDGTTYSKGKQSFQNNSHRDNYRVSNESPMKDLMSQIYDTRTTSMTKSKLPAPDRSARFQSSNDYGDVLRADDTLLFPPANPKHSAARAHSIDSDFIRGTDSQ